MPDDLPHLDLPFRWIGSNLATVEQGEVKDIQNQVFNVVATPKGSRDEYPAFGNPQYTPFGIAPLDTNALQAAIDDLVPDAKAVLTEHGVDLDETVRHITVNVNPEQT